MIKIKKFQPGEEFLFLGKPYPLLADAELPKAVIFDGSLKISPLVLGNARDHLEYWYKARALDYITTRVEHYSRLTDLRYRTLRLSNASRQWGSCGFRGNLNFTWRLIMAPERVVDYVVVHELMHLKQKNHSRLFWQEVVGVIPDYKQDEHWLKQNGHLLAWPA